MKNSLHENFIDIPMNAFKLRVHDAWLTLIRSIIQMLKSYLIPVQKCTWLTSKIKQ
jgi:hypothetical protein